MDTVDVCKHINIVEEVSMMSATVSSLQGRGYCVLTTIVDN